MNMKMFDISTKKKIMSTKRNHHQKYHEMFWLEKSWFPIGAGTDDMTSSVVDPGERPMTKDNHLLGKLLEEQWISSEENPEMGSW